MHALIIEPQAFTACAIEDALRDIGYTSFDFAIAAAEAITAAHDHRPDLITAAVNLEPGSGIAAAQAICGGRPIPVVYITEECAAVRTSEPEAPIVRKQPFTLSGLSAAVTRARTLCARLRAAPK